ncbi:ABC transporter permease [Chloroflexota bacterium]
MIRFLAVRLVQIVFLLLVFQTLLFFVLEAMPGDISNMFIGNPDIPPEAKQIIIQRLGLDKPIGERYLNYIRNFVTGDLGVSYVHYPKPVLDIIAERAPRTIVLFATSTLVSFLTGFVLGKQLAWRRGGFYEYTLTIGGAILYTVFTPWFGLIMIWLFSFKLGLFPVGGFLTPQKWSGAPMSANVVFNRMILSAVVFGLLVGALYYFTRKLTPWKREVRLTGVALLIVATIAIWAASPLGPYALDIAHHVVLPVLTLTLVAFAGTMLLTRNSMLETLREDYILTARAKGLSEQVVRDKHAARNALLPVVTSLVLALAFVISGGIITETIFSWPGMGQTLLQASLTEDIPLAVGALSFVAVLALLAHLFVDILYFYLDPRMRSQG